IHSFGALALVAGVAVATTAVAVVGTSAPAAAVEQEHTFRHDGRALRSWTVPDGVSSVRLEAVGANGGAGVGHELWNEFGGDAGGGPGGAGGKGARVWAWFAVNPGDVIYFEVGENGR